MGHTVLAVFLELLFTKYGEQNLFKYIKTHPRRLVTEYVDVDFGLSNFLSGRTEIIFIFICHFCCLYFMKKLVQPVLFKSGMSTGKRASPF